MTIVNITMRLQKAKKEYHDKKNSMRVEKHEHYQGIFNFVENKINHYHDVQTKAKNIVDEAFQKTITISGQLAANQMKSEYEKKIQQMTDDLEKEIISELSPLLDEVDNLLEEEIIDIKALTDQLALVKIKNNSTDPKVRDEAEVAVKILMKNFLQHLKQQKPELDLMLSSEDPIKKASAQGVKELLNQAKLEIEKLCKREKVLVSTATAGSNSESTASDATATGFSTKEKMEKTFMFNEVLIAGVKVSVGPDSSLNNGEKPQVSTPSAAK